ncbi:biotin/lipoyl-containing protein [uncultured Selenomonas sp.]|uniref:biotin/lipoyl-containing protein n=1 Tax=uncultured Selenomonas sp. TaxID=159275 RepID=UPI0028D1E024|nr:biotin/lipoyl-containing protein [uncultured Selenomonas sp.]
MKKFNITVNGTAYDVEVEEVRGGAAAAPAAPRAAAPAPAPAPKAAAPAPAAAPVKAAAAGETAIDAPMPGKILEVKVSVGQAVKAGDTLVILEAMKMQNEIPATVDGTVKAINCSAGQSVKVRDSLVVIG